MEDLQTKVVLASAGQPSKSTNQFWSRLEALTKLTALFAGMVYSAGFFIVSIDHAEFGVMEASLFRPKIFTAGATFMIMVLSGGLSAFRTFSTVVRYRAPINVIKWTNETKRHVDLFMACNFYTVATGVASLFSFLIQPDETVHTEFVWLWITLGVAWVVLYSAVLTLIGTNDGVIKQPWNSVIVAFLLNVDLFLISRGAQLQALWLTLFLYCAGLGLLFLYNQLKTAESIRTLEFERLIPIATALVIFYGSVVYGQIRPTYGGGRPILAQVYLNQSVADLPKGRLTLGIIEETDHGFYVVRSNDRQATFIPRSEISGIRFGKD